MSGLFGSFTAALVLMMVFMVVEAQGQTLPDTQPLTLQGDLAAQMLTGIDRFLTRETALVGQRREQYWHCDFSSPDAYVRSVEPNRLRLRKIIGVVDERETCEMVSDVDAAVGRLQETRVAKGIGYDIFAVRWSVLQGVQGEGLLLLPTKTPVADIVALPDCDWTPEMLTGMAKGIPPNAQFARRMAENGCRVLVPFLIDRQDTYSGVPGIAMTNQSHREFLYRPAYEMGRHIIGYEVQKTLAAVDWFTQTAGTAGKTKRRPIGVIGYGEGGLIAFYAAAIDTRIDATVVSGYFQPREALWREPLYRNVFGLLEQFGDAEIAGLIAPRALLIEACRHPESSGPPAPEPGRSGAAPGVLETPPFAVVQGEFTRAQRLTQALHPTPVLTLDGAGSGLPGSDAALTGFMQALGMTRKLQPIAAAPTLFRKRYDPAPRLRRQIEQILEHTQRCMRESPDRRAAFWQKADATSAATWERSLPAYRDYFWNEIIGRLPPSTLPANPRSRKIIDTPTVQGYEVVLDVYPDVFAYGILLVPKDIQLGERRPVVVCQHGLEGRPQDVADPAIDNQYYHQFAYKLAERGYITFAPQNPYIGEEKFRVLLRKAQPLKQTLFAVIVRQHERILDWLGSLPNVDSKRIAFYGLSYGGKTAMRVPALLDRYCLSICSADYSEWIWKCTSASSRYSYIFTREYDMPEFDLGNTFNYAEMSWLICPRPFMVERGHQDGVAPDEWVAYEFARTRRHYVRLGLGDRTEIEFFNGPHTIHGVGTFAFLDRFLKPP